MTNSVFSVCVFCGSRPGNDPAYLEAAEELGQAIATKGWRLVYGSGDLGIMGAVAKIAYENGGSVLGVIPKHLLQYESLGIAIGERIVTETMHERKKIMFMNSDAVVMLPGGAGSLEEFFEGLTWSQIGVHEKPIFVVDVNGYWQPLTSLIEHVIAEGFASDGLQTLYQTVPTVSDLVSALSKVCRS